MVFEGFSEKDYDTYLPAHRGSATYTLQRMQVKDKLQAWVVALTPGVGDALTGMEARFSSHAPSLENNRSVADQSVWWIRGASEAQALKTLVEKVDLQSANALDVAAWHKHGAVGVVVGNNGVDVAVVFHPRGAVDRHNLKAKLAEGWAQEAFAQLLGGLGQPWQVQYPGQPPVEASMVDAAGAAGLVRQLEEDGEFRVFCPLGRQLDGPALTQQVLERLAQAMAVYRFAAWAPEHDHIQAVKAARHEREEVARASSMRVGDKVRILTGAWNGRVGVVQVVDKKGGLKVQVGPVSVRLDAKDAQPA